MVRIRAAQEGLKSLHNSYRREKTLAGTTAAFDGEEFKLTEHADTLIYFIVERQKVSDKHYAGEKQPWSEDWVFHRTRFTNVFRIYDRDTQYIVNKVIMEGDQNFRETCFRVVLFRLFDRIETFEYLQSVLPVTWRDWDRRAYVKALDERMVEGYSVYGNAYQMMPPAASKVGGSPNKNHERHLRLLEALMNLDLPGELRKLDEFADMFHRIYFFPTLKDFLGFQLLLDLNMVPGLRRPQDWVVCGPGCRRGLEFIFGPSVKGHYGSALAWLFEHQHNLYQAAGVNPNDVPALMPSYRGVPLIDLEHTMCELSKYITIKARGPGARSKRVYKPSSEPITRTLPPRWKENVLTSMDRDKKYTNPHAVHQGNTEEDTEWAVSHIVDDGVVDGEEKYLVRWKGYSPDADTWEPLKNLENAQDVLDEYLRLKQAVEDECARLCAAR